MKLYYFYEKFISDMEAFGIYVFILVMGMAWWLLVFLGLFMPYVATLLIVNKFSPKMANAMAIWK